MVAEITDLLSVLSHLAVGEHQHQKHQQHASTRHSTQILDLCEQNLAAGDLSS